MGGTRILSLYPFFDTIPNHLSNKVKKVQLNYIPDVKSYLLLLFNFVIDMPKWHFKINAKIIILYLPSCHALNIRRDYVFNHISNVLSSSFSLKKTANYFPIDLSLYANPKMSFKKQKSHKFLINQSINKRLFDPKRLRQKCFLCGKYQLHVRLSWIEDRYAKIL